MAALFRIGLENAAVASLLALVVAVLSRVFRRRAALVHVLWVVVLLKLVAPPLYSVSVPTQWVAPDVERAKMIAPFDRDIRKDGVVETVLVQEPRIEGDAWLADGVLSAPGSDRIPAPDLTLIASPGPPDTIGLSSHPVLINVPDGVSVSAQITTLLGGLWLIGTCAAAVVTITRVLRFRRVLTMLKPATEDVEDLVCDTAHDLGLRRLPVIGMAPGNIAPMVWCLGGTPRLILPTDLWKALDKRGRVTLVAHELAHLKRGDHWVRMLETLVTIAFWWLPTVWWVRTALRDVEERCCDAWVVWAYPGDARAYAETLLETVDFLSSARTPMPALASGFGRVHSLKRRLTMILRGTTTRSLGFSGGVFALALTALLPVRPSFGQSEDKAPLADPKPDAAPLISVIDGASVGRFIYQVAPDGKVVATVREESQDGVKKGPDQAPVVEVRYISNDALVAKGDVLIQPDTLDSATTEVYTGEVKEIVTKIRGKIDELKAKSDKSKGDQAKIDALTRIVDSLERSATARGFRWTTTRDVEKRVAEPLIIMRQQDAEAQKLQAEIAELRAIAQKHHAMMQEANAKMLEAQKKLTETARRLADLTGKAKGAVSFNVARPVEGYRVGTFRQNRPLDVVPAPPTQAPPAAPNQDQERRLAEVEKKLERILNQLESIKKPETVGK
jgi:bla regulator protein blaR1